MLCPCERLKQQQGKMQSDKMCPVTLGNHKTKTPIGRHPWQPPTPAGFEQGVPWRSPCEHSNSSRIRAHATQNAIRQNAFRYLRNPYKTNALVRFRNTRTPAGPVPKHPNTRRMRAHATQNACQKTLSRHLWNP